MTNHNNSPWQHNHTFGQDKKRPGEKRTLAVIIITGIMMVVEIASGIIFGSLALLADGIHMGSHAAALMITAFAYIYARRQANNESYNFGTGKVNALAGYSSAIILGAFALTMVIESVERFLNPGKIEFDQAIIVAIVGLIVNAVSALFLNPPGEQNHHGHSHGSDHQGEHHSDQNLRSAYLHVLADALTSILAVIALLGGKYLNLVWLDPIMGLVGAFLVASWSWGLIKDTHGVLLDRQGPENTRRAILSAFENRESDEVSDFHLWQIGPGIYAAIVSIVSSNPQPVEVYKDLIPKDRGVVHITVEVYSRNQ